MLNIWFLVIVTSLPGNGTGVTHIAQANKVHCELNAKWIGAKQRTDAYCVSGISVK